MVILVVENLVAGKGVKEMAVLVYFDQKMAFWSCYVKLSTVLQLVTCLNKTVEQFCHSAVVYLVKVVKTI